MGWTVTISGEDEAALYKNLAQGFMKMVDDLKAQGFAIVSADFTHTGVKSLISGGNFKKDLV